MQIISDQSVQIRSEWISLIQNQTGDFLQNIQTINRLLAHQKNTNETFRDYLIDALRLCGSIPESYEHDSTQEKVYSKFTDYLINYAFLEMGFSSSVLSERADSADVESFSSAYSFVSDAKAFRLSRTAKNQKDFKVSAMNTWRRDRDFAMIVCPIYQLPSKTSQIYEQATRLSVCIFTYSHLSLLTKYSSIDGIEKAQELLRAIFSLIETMNPSKSSPDYWIPINRLILDFSPQIKELWLVEKNASNESTLIAKQEALNFLYSERARIHSLTHAEAIDELINIKNINNKILVINKVAASGLFNLL